MFFPAPNLFILRWGDGKEKVDVTQPKEL